MARYSLTPHRLLAAVLLSAVFSGCAGGGNGGSGLPQWSAVEELRIGSADDADRRLTTVSALVVDDDGWVYVAQPEDGVVRVFDDGGILVRYIGGRGQEPGSFDRVYTIGLLADTLYAIDLSQRRISYFSLEGEHLRSTQVAPPRVSAPFRPSMPFAVFPDGSMALGTSFPPSISAEDLRRVPQLRMDAATQVLDTVTWIAYERTARRASYLERPLTVGSPLSDDAFAMFSGDGSRLATFDRTVAAGAGTASFGVIVADETGDTIYSRRYEYTPVQVANAVIDSTVSERANQLSGAFEDPSEAPAFVRAAMFLPVYHPPVGTAVFSADETLWVRREEVPGQNQSWMILDETGEPVATATLPEGLQVMVIHSDALWGVEPDQNGVPYVVRYRIDR
jgi:hypothetical protein